MNNNFKIGDNVYLIGAYGVHTLFKNSIYVVEDIKPSHDTTQLLGVVGEDGTLLYYSSRRFTTDLRPIRKKKLKQIYEKYGE